MILIDPYQSKNLESLRRDIYYMLDINTAVFYSAHAKLFKPLQAKVRPIGIIRPKSI